MFLASLSAVHEPAQVTRGGFHDRPIIHIKLGALTLTCSVEDARELASDLFRVSEAAAPRGAECDAPVAPDCTVTFDRILRGNADLVPAEHATLRAEPVAPAVPATRYARMNRDSNYFKTGDVLEVVPYTSDTFGPGRADGSDADGWFWAKDQHDDPVCIGHPGESFDWCDAPALERAA